VLTKIFNLCYGVHYSDLCYGFNVFWQRHVPALGLDPTSPPPDYGDGRLWGDGFEVETLIHIRVAKAGLAVTEVASFEHSRIHGVSNLNALSDGVRVLRTIFIERRHARRRSAVRSGPAAVGAAFGTAEGRPDPLAPVSLDRAGPPVLVPDGRIDSAQLN
jgi:hypothetical protein